MIRNRFHLCLALAALALLVAVPSAEAQSPDWPENGNHYKCIYTWPNGDQGQSVIKFINLPADSHQFPDGNELKRGDFFTYLPGIQGKDNPQTTLSNRAVLAYKPNELPSPFSGTRFELTLTDNGIQCKNMVNHQDGALTFSQCSNGITQFCTFCDPAPQANEFIRCP